MKMQKEFEYVIIDKQNKNIQSIKYIFYWKKKYSVEKTFPIFLIVSKYVHFIFIKTERKPCLSDNIINFGTF